MLEFLRKLFGGKDLKLIIQNGAVIVDVRTVKEFQRGSADGAINIPLGVLGKNIDKMRQMKKPIITCCASGMRSDAAKRQLESYRIEAYNGGSWQSISRKLQ